VAQLVPRAAVRARHQRVQLVPAHAPIHPRAGDPPPVLVVARVGEQRAQLILLIVQRAQLAHCDALVLGQRGVAQLRDQLLLVLRRQRRVRAQTHRAVPQRARPQYHEAQSLAGTIVVGCAQHLHLEIVREADIRTLEELVRSAVTRTPFVHDQRITQLAYCGGCVCCCSCC